MDLPMESLGSAAKLCDICSKLDVQLLACPLSPCRNPLPCVVHPLERVNLGSYTALGSVDEIKSRRSTCDICKLVAKSLDEDFLAGLTGTCRITEAEKYCTFTLSSNVQTSDSSVTHFHLTDAVVIFEPSVEEQFQGPPLPWEVKSRVACASRYLLRLQAKAMSYPGPGNLPVVSPREEQEFLKTIGGRHVGTRIDAQLIRAWLHGCEHEHGDDCMPPTQLLAERYEQPTFVVDVVESCLVDTPLNCRYVALSYVRGDVAVLNHLLENTQDLRKPGSLRSLPLPVTIQDAITLVLAIGERYLWVDSLCIIQDDVKMRQTEIMRMGSIYSHGLFTIVAAAGNDANSGLPGVGQGSRGKAQEILKLDNCELLTVLDVRNLPSGIDETAWGQRAWTFQEQALSSRMLVFSENQVYWRCRTASHSEERALENVHVLERLRLPFPHASATDSVPWKTLAPLDYCDLYDELLYVYRRRRLTYQKDILNAFNGVTEMLATLQKDIFFWGLPGSFFSYALVWDLTRGASRNDVEIPVVQNKGSVEMIPIPSWSWAAWSGLDLHHISDLRDGGKSIVCSVIQFYIVDSNLELVAIEERPWPDKADAGDRVRAAWRDAQPHPPPPLPQDPPLQMGQLRFWTCLAHVKVVRRWGVGIVGSYYTFSIPDDFQANPHATVDGAELVHQDFIVVAARTHGGLILLAVDWMDGVAYRVGKAEVTEAEWALVGNKQWRWITLG